MAQEREIHREIMPAAAAPTERDDQNLVAA
jgi:hypothetical protein